MNKKIAYLAAGNSIHTVRWLNALAQRGYQMTLLTLHEVQEPLHAQVQVIKLPIPSPWGYVLNGPWLKKWLAHHQPAILHVHYASGYGTLARLSGFQPLVLSVWGSDILDFPQRSRLHRYWLQHNLRAADHICATSHYLAHATQPLAPNRPMSVIAFGIDTQLFCPQPQRPQQHLLKIGTVKTLATIYGIDILIQAFAELRQQLLHTQPLLAHALRLGIAGEGPQQTHLQKLVSQLGLATVTEWRGPLPHAAVPHYLNQLQIFVAASRRESFGVAVLEASACGVPVVVARVGGLAEVVAHGISGFWVETENIQALTQSLLTLVQDEHLRRHMGQAGRQWVATHYEWQAHVQRLETLYATLLGR